MGQRLNLERFHQVILWGAIFLHIMRDYLIIGLVNFQELYFHKIDKIWVAGAYLCY